MSSEYKSYTDRMDKTIETLSSEFASVRAGRANPAVLDRVSFDYYGTQTPINQIATISAPEPHLLIVQPWDSSCLKDIEKAIYSSELGINPQNDGKCIRLAFPQLTEERRKELTKRVRKYAEECKVAIRNIRREAIDDFKALKKKSEITEDDMKMCEKDIQDLTDKYTKDIDTLLNKKEKELLDI